ncbi:Flp family type IVb pilin [Sinorhizobium sp. 7-81]|uniref:Flp family type IVb pilin n=1 Tax=Sinorhizobium sp. 8-89 TaxID=3049089 RepID=UPI0024C2A547|nr:Flp family type IVb pilin [Sinorhizobium sp. 8-89]MDK1490885.1 Flp family type IVb pilin [Sinorhizobium sp. 8-89]
MKKLLVAFTRNESGATAIEYSLIAGLIAVALITGATTLGGKIDTMFTTISGKL